MPTNTVKKWAPPGYEIKVGDLPATEVFKSRILSVSVHLYDGSQSDQLMLTFDDSPRTWSKKLAIPENGKKLEVRLGYDLFGAKALLGIYYVDQVTLSGSASGRTLSVTAVPKLLLNETTRTWSDTTLGNIIREIAGKNALKDVVSESLSTVAIVLENQTRETDLSFVTRLAEKYGAMAKPAANRLLFLKKGEARNAAGKLLNAVSINTDDVIQWSCQLSERTEYHSVVAIWYDRVMAKQVQQKATTTNPLSKSQDVFYLPSAYLDQAEARAAAQAKLDELNRDTYTLSLSVVGNPNLEAGRAINVKQLHSSVDGEWIIRSVSHTLDSGGYQCSLECYKNG